MSIIWDFYIVWKYLPNTGEKKNTQSPFYNNEGYMWNTGDFSLLLSSLSPFYTLLAPLFCYLSKFLLQQTKTKLCLVGIYQHCACISKSTTLMKWTQEIENQPHRESASGSAVRANIGRAPDQSLLWVRQLKWLPSRGSSYISPTQSWLSATTSLGGYFYVFLTQVVLPALQGQLLQGRPGRGDVHMPSVIAGQRHFENVLQHLTLAVHQLCPHPVHCLQQQLPACGERTIISVHYQSIVISRRFLWLNMRLMLFLTSRY